MAAFYQVGTPVTVAKGRWQGLTGKVRSVIMPHPENKRTEFFHVVSFDAYRPEEEVANGAVNGMDIAGNPLGPYGDIPASDLV